MSEYHWLKVEAVLAVHTEQLARNGGLAGVRDAGALESAMARPRNAAAYGHPDIADLAAAYAFGIARNHPFTDANKRTAWIAARLFVESNGKEINVPQADIVTFMLALAAGELKEDAAAAWFRARME